MARLLKAYILGEVGSYYTEIFTCDPWIQAKMDERRQAFLLISNKPNPLERAIHDKEPMFIEVEAVIKTFKSGKSLGLSLMALLLRYFVFARSGLGRLAFMLF